MKALRTILAVFLEDHTLNNFAFVGKKARAQAVLTRRLAWGSWDEIVRTILAVFLEDRSLQLVLPLKYLVLNGKVYFQSR